MTCIALIGLMGSGKSTIGALLAEHTGARFVDVDDMIETQTGHTVRELWEEGGEPAYRRLEHDACIDAIASGTGTDDDVVLATPGGAVLDPLVADALGTCTVIWLRADPAVLGARVTVGDHRPLIGDDPTTVLSAMSDERANVYASLADMTIDVDRMTPDAAATAILEILDAGDSIDASDPPTIGH